MGAKKAIRHLGRIKVWNDDRGFGFIEAGRGHEVFVHIKDFANLPGRPEVDQEVSFELGFDDRKRRRALNVELCSQHSEAQRVKAAEFRKPVATRLVAFVVVAGVIALLGWQKLLTFEFFALYVFGSLASLLAYTLDKAAAGTGARRTPEATLHLIDFIGGWPGGLLAQAILRHKTKKARFQALFWTTVAMNVLVVAALVVFRP